LLVGPTDASFSGPFEENILLGPRLRVSSLGLFLFSIPYSTVPLENPRSDFKLIFQIIVHAQTLTFT
jgi:hypothetical protein